MAYLEIQSRYVIGDDINISGDEDEFGAILFNQESLVESVIGVEVGTSIGKILVVSIYLYFVAEEDVAEVFEGFSYS